METVALRLAGHIGLTIRDARSARRWTLRELADRCGVSITRLHDIEHGRPASLETYVAIARALALDLRVDLTDPRRRASSLPLEDPVHAAMGEVIAARMAGHGFGVAIDEPYQHFQFAGRADVVAWTADARHLLHVENRTRFPNLQEAAGSYNAKRRYLAGEMAERLGRSGRGFEGVTHVMAGLWSSEVIHAVRIRPATFRAICPDGSAAFDAWWSGRAPEAGVTSAFVAVDPAAMGRQAAWTDVMESTRPRHRGYADALTALSRAAASRS